MVHAHHQRLLLPLLAALVMVPVTGTRMSGILMVIVTMFFFSILFFKLSLFPTYAALSVIKEMLLVEMILQVPGVCHMLTAFLI